jgi:hypothetical protein
MTTALLSLLAGLASLTLWWLQRRDARAADPQLEKEQADADADQVVARGAAGVDDLNRLVQRGLDRRVRRPGGGDPGGS